MIGWYDRAGRPITVEEADVILRDPVARRVAETTIGPYWISTVLLVIDHNWGEGPPLIFETMVFGSDDSFEDLDCQRYCAETEALAGHEQMVAKFAERVALAELSDDDT